MKIIQNLRRIIGGVLLLLLAVNFAASAETDPSTIINGTLRTVCASGCDFTTIADAIAGSDAGDTIRLDDPIHTETDILIDKDITLMGLSPASILQAYDQPPTSYFNSLIVVSENSSVAIKNLTIRKGYTDANGGAIRNLGDLTVSNVRFFNNLTELRGGAIYNQGNLSVANTRFRENSGLWGGAIYNKGVASINNSEISLNQSVRGAAIYATYEFGFENGLTIENTIITENSNRDNEIGSEALYVESTHMTLTDSIIENNPGRGLYAYKSFYLIDRTIFRGSTRSAISTWYSDDDERSVISNSTFENNHGINGGAIYSFEAYLQISKSVFTGNSAEENGGALYGYSMRPIEYSVFEGNTAKNGGAIGGNDWNTISVQNSLIKDNIATEKGGGIYRGGLIANTTVTGNSAYEGGGAYSAVFAHSTVVSNTAEIGAGYRRPLTGFSPRVYYGNNIIFHNSPGNDCEGYDVPAYPTFGNSIIGTDSCGIVDSEFGNIVADPKLLPLSADNVPLVGINQTPIQIFPLSEDSPAIDHGAEATCLSDFFEISGMDQRGYERSDGLCDVGAFEYFAGVPSAVTFDFIDGEVSSILIWILGSLFVLLSGTLSLMQRQNR